METLTLEEGTVVYHGTSSKEDFKIPDMTGFAWVSTSRSVAEYFAKSRRGPRPRVLVFHLYKDVELFLVSSAQDFDELAEEEGEGEAPSGPDELAQMVCDAGYDGWIIPTNYPDGDDVLLCYPEDALDLVNAIPLQDQDRKTNPTKLKNRLMR